MINKPWHPIDLLHFSIIPSRRKEEGSQAKSSPLINISNITCFFFSPSPPLITAKRPINDTVWHDIWLLGANYHAYSNQPASQSWQPVRQAKPISFSSSSFPSFFFFFFLFDLSILAIGKERERNKCKLTAQNKEQGKDGGKKEHNSLKSI